MRFRRMVVLPEPRKPVRIVIGIGAMVVVVVVLVAEGERGRGGVAGCRYCSISVSGESKR